MDKSKLSTGQYFGYYDESGNWVTGQNGPNPMTAEQEAIVAKWEEVYKPYDDSGPYSYLLSKRYWKAVLNDLLFVFGFKSDPD